ncbi:hypothetical protein M1614_03325 [Candidatus Marsarchaeota archaeon]|jgi:hypothetical protein|nr:hypothetical protein [Candidatus Marsarchaeota archaeon]MCL5090311.1 hypothetical protein [Candidatus Marsarchaeota archaeon]
MVEIIDFKKKNVIDFAKIKSEKQFEREKNTQKSFDINKNEGYIKELLVELKENLPGRDRWVENMSNFFFAEKNRSLLEVTELENFVMDFRYNGVYGQGTSIVRALTGEIDLIKEIYMHLNSLPIEKGQKREIYKNLTVGLTQKEKEFICNYGNVIRRE